MRRVQIETIRANVIGCLNLADICLQQGLHMTYYGTGARARAGGRGGGRGAPPPLPTHPRALQLAAGCIFHYDDDFPQGSGKGFKEVDKPNFTGSYYSYTKAIVESMLKEFPNVLTLRVRMPIVPDLSYPRNFITKIIKYDKVIDIPNSMTVLPELLPMSIEMAKRKLTGIMNYTNPGAISHNEILQVRQGRGVIRARAPARLLPLFTPSSRPAPLRSFSRTMWTPSSHGPTLRWRSRPR